MPILAIYLILIGAMGRFDVPMTGKSTPDAPPLGARLLVVRMFAVTVSGCSDRSQDAVVIAKEHGAAHVEGTEYKERELDHEQWLVEVRMKSGLRARAPVDEAQWNVLNAGDRVRARYSQGKYTGTVWAIEIEKE